MSLPTISAFNLLNTEMVDAKHYPLEPRAVGTGARIKRAAPVGVKNYIHSIH